MGLSPDLMNIHPYRMSPFAPYSSFSLGHGLSFHLRGYYITRVIVIQCFDFVALVHTETRTDASQHVRLSIARS